MTDVLLAIPEWTKDGYGCAMVTAAPLFILTLFAIVRRNRRVTE